MLDAVVLDLTRGVTVTLKGGSRHCRPVSLAIAPGDARQQEQRFYRKIVLFNDPERKAATVAVALPEPGSMVCQTLGGWTGCPVGRSLQCRNSTEVPMGPQEHKVERGWWPFSRQT